MGRWARPDDAITRLFGIESRDTSRVLTTLRLVGALERETLRLNTRYLEEIVERFELCPWARATRRNGHLARAVVRGNPPAYSVLLAQMDRWARDEQWDVAMLLLPEAGLSRPAFARFVSALIAEDAARRPLGASTPFALAAFHPDAEPDFASADRLVPYVRRTPDPTIQVVRISALEKARAGESTGTAYVDPKTLDLQALLSRPERPALRERIAAANHRSLEVARDEVARIFASIEEDHRTTRQRLASSEAPGKRVP